MQLLKKKQRLLKKSKQLEGIIAVTEYADYNEIRIPIKQMIPNFHS